MYVGYMYTEGEAHGFSTSSIIKEANDAFYTDVLSSYASYIDIDAGFCGDRSTLNLQNGVGTGTETTYYKGYVRVMLSTPSLLCENENDLYTLSSSNQGNKALSYPIGLITADEVMLAGTGGGLLDGTYNYQPTNLNGYLIIGNYFWTMTPAGGYIPFGGTSWYSRMFSMNLTGSIDDYATYNENSLRPVINLKADVTITGEGTKENPYTSFLKNGSLNKDLLFFIYGIYYSYEWKVIIWLH